jgi:hypothetical protein
MEIKRKLLFLVFFIFLASLASAQTPGYFIRSENDQLRFFQRFVWRGGENALRYEVIFEREDNGRYVSHSREFTTSLYIEVSLPPGNYRIQVIPYDILGRPWEGSERKYFQVLPAPRPEIPDTLPDSEPEMEFEMEIEMEIEIEMEPQIEPEVELEPEPVVIVEQDPEIYIEYEYEPEQEYIHDALEKLNQVFLSFGLSWKPSFTVYGNNSDDFFDPLGIEARVNIVFLTPLDIFMGMEFGAYFSSDEHFFENFDDFSLSMIINLIALKWTPDQRIAFGFRFGVHYPLVYRKNETRDENFSLSHFIPGCGIFVRWRVTNNLLLETGIDYSNKFGTTPIGYLRPWLGFGMQF